MNTRNWILKVNKLNKSYKSVEAVKDLSFTVEAGDIFAFLGPNGAGKTTTLRILLDIIKADSGEISWHLDQKESNLALVNKIGYLPEERGLYEDVQVIKSLVYLASIRGANPKQAKKSAYEWLEKLELVDRAKVKLQELSKGNQQKIQFIASILHKPKFAILDEPFTGMDPINQEKFIGYIKDLNQAGTTILLSSHQMQLIEKIANKVLLINNGLDLYNGSLADIYLKHQDQLSFEVRLSNEDNLEDLTSLSGISNVFKISSQSYRLIFSSGVSLAQSLQLLSKVKNITSINSSSMNLHDIFVKLVKER